MNKIYDDKITALRAVAITSVILYHFGAMKHGYLGVDVFFLISGYLIFSIIKGGKISWTEFLIRRLKRIFPPLFIMVVIVYIILLILKENSDKIFLSGSIITSLSFYSNFYYIDNIDYWSPDVAKIHFIHLWSTSVEMQFYLICSIFILIIRRIENIGTFALFCGLLCISCITYYISYSQWFYSPISRIWEFCLGGCFYIWGRQLRNSKAELLWMKYIEFVVILVAILILTGLFLQEVHIILRQMILLIACGVYIINRTSPAWIYNFVNLKFVQNIGITSYGLYLWHQPVIAYLNTHVKEHSLAAIMVAIFIIYISSQLSYRLVEQHFKSNEPKIKKYLYVTLIIGGLFVALVFSFKTIYKKELFDREVERRESTTVYVEKGFNGKLNKDWESNGKRKIILIGDSFAQDFFNVLYEGHLLNDVDIITHFINTGCQNVPVTVDYEPHILEQNREACKHVARIGSKSLDDKIRKSDGVIIATKWTEFTSKHIIETIQAIKNLGIMNIIVVGRKEFVLDSEDRIIDDGVIFHKSSAEYVSVIKRMKTFDIENYIDVHDIVCVTRGDYYCPLMTNGGDHISFDGTHLTREGATYIANKLNNNPQFENLWMKFARVQK